MPIILQVGAPITLGRGFGQLVFTALALGEMFEYVNVQRLRIDQLLSTSRTHHVDVCRNERGWMSIPFLLSMVDRYLGREWTSGGGGGGGGKGVQAAIISCQSPEI